MRIPRSMATIALASLALVAVSCGGDGDEDPSPTGSPTGLSSEAAATAVEALCRMASIGDPAEAKATFYNDAHVTLHAIAREADANRVGSDAELLISMQRVEAELEEPSLPAAYPDDVRALRLATVRALESIDLQAPSC